MDPNQPAEDGDVPLTIAAREGHCAAVVALLAAGADVGGNSGGCGTGGGSGGDGLTPLELLLDSDAACDPVGPFAYKPFERTQFDPTHTTERMGALPRKIARFDERNRNDETRTIISQLSHLMKPLPLYNDCRQQSYINPYDEERDPEALRATVAALVSAGADVDSSGKTQRLYKGDVAGDRPLHTALRLGRRCESTVFEFIGSGGSDDEGGGDCDGDGDGNRDGGKGGVGGEDAITAVDGEAAAAATAAKKKKEKKRATRAKVANQVGKDDVTPLLIAAGSAGRGSPAVVKRLLQLAPTLVDNRDDAGESALLRAARRLCSGVDCGGGGGGGDGGGGGGGWGGGASGSSSNTANASDDEDGHHAWGVFTALLAASADPNLSSSAATAAKGETPLLVVARACARVKKRSSGGDDGGCGGGGSSAGGPSRLRQGRQLIRVFARLAA